MYTIWYRYFEENVAKSIILKVVVALYKYFSTSNQKSKIFYNAN